MTEAIHRQTEPEELIDEYQDLIWIPAPCQKTCPVGTDVPSYVGLIWEERFGEAIEAITATNPFSSVCGRICAKPCETECRRGESDAPVAIRSLKRFVMDKVGADYRLPEVRVTRSQTIGIVGGGPTGLTAAQDLAELGFEVHVYEKSDRLGGMLYTIPEFRLPRKEVESDIQRVLSHCPGIKVHFNTGLGTEIHLEELKKRHDAVLLSIGLWSDRRLNAPGEEEGVEGLYGIDFLNDYSAGADISLPEKVVVIGGGNVAMDVARTALRAGAKDIKLYCLESRKEMPAWKHEIEQTEAEGIKINPSWGVKQILVHDNKVTGIELKRCTSVFDSEGRFNPAYDDNTTMTIEAGAVLLAIGLQSVNDELQGLGMMSRGLVNADFDTMRTSDPKVFAGGDCAFGPSAVVHAMHHGHKAAYYIRAFLEGHENPLPYSTPYRTRMVPVAQDPMWEKLPREEQEFHPFQHGQPAVVENESTYDWDMARRQAARCLRCDAETGHSDYTRQARETIHAMARTEPGDTDTLRLLTLERLKPRENPFPPSRPAHIEDLVFLSAALTRLVIDPYREKCATQTRLGASFELQQPYLFTGFDDVSKDLQQALASGLRSTGCAYIGRKPLYAGLPSNGGESKKRGAPWIQLLLSADDKPHPDADGLVYVLGSRFEPVKLKRFREGQLLGLSVAAPIIEEAVPFALEQEYDLLILDGTEGIEKSWVELKGAPDLSVMRDAIRVLRRLNREEDIALAYFGGLRSGTDVAKSLAINCNAGIFSVAMGIAMGGTINDGRLNFDGGRTIEERQLAIENWIKGTAQETAIIARCTGKTNVHNLEPEDMRSITLITSEAMGIPMASGSEKREGF